MEENRFPFGRPSTERPPRRPAPHQPTKLFILGAYPSALHIRWDLPRWAHKIVGRERVGALAVDVEPTAFWDGADAEERVAKWKTLVNWRDGDGEGDWGWAMAAGNGTTGAAVKLHVLRPLGTSPAETWFTDALPRFYIKAGVSRRPQQADVLREVYDPIAPGLGLERASLPPRPSRGRLVQIAATEERDRLLQEIDEAAALRIVTLGEEARRVLNALAEATDGPPTRALDRHDYGRPGTATFGGRTIEWYALTHPGNRNPGWRVARERWVDSLDK